MLGLRTFLRASLCVNLTSKFSRSVSLVFFPFGTSCQPSPTDLKCFLAMPLNWIWEGSRKGGREGGREGGVDFN